MAATSITADVVQIAIEQVFDALGEVLPGQDEGAALPRPTRSTGPVFAMENGFYRDKCKQLDDMELKYMAKCNEFDQLLSRYRQLQTRLQADPQPLFQDAYEPRPMSKTAAVAAKLSAQKPAKEYTFEDFDELERRMCPQSNKRRRVAAARPLVSPSFERKPARRGGQSSVTPSKRARRNPPPGIRSLNLVSSPPLVRGPAGGGSRVFGPEKSSRGGGEVQGPAKAGPSGAVKFSSQDTQLDSSDPCLPSDIMVELCPATDEEDNGGGKGAEDSAGSKGADPWKAVLDQPQERAAEKASAWVRQNQQAGSSSKADGKHSEQLQRILSALGDCEQCRVFYKTPGLVLPKRDPSTLCIHGKKGKAKAQTPARAPGRTGEAPQSEERRHTPEQFWDIEYFPAIRTAGPEVLRKRQSQSAQK
ncbi:hypothetical protein GGF46_001184 [Coemansia sp. RSA 552]|nr:hypothetical protein GGF46_001184 [Coemansia sp. RSA 552]